MKRILLGILIISLFLPLSLRAEPRHGFARSLPERHETFGFQGERLHYFAGRFYRPVIGGFYLIPPPIGATVSFLPDGYLTVMIGNNAYYYYGNIFYRPYRTGFIVVAPPVSDTTTIDTLTYATKEAAGGMVFTVNVPNSRGSFNEVKLTQYGKGYLGPQGEYYTGHPTVEELKVLYGK